VSQGERPARDLGIILLLAALIILPPLATRDLWSPDEPRYMEVAWEMVACHNYLVPHLNGEVYYEKPPLFFWAASALYQLGLRENAGRVVAGLATTATVLLVYFFARHCWPPPVPLWTALVLLTTYLFLSRMKRGVLDPVLTLFTTAAIMAGYRALHACGRARAIWWMLFYVSLAAAVLTKGHVGFFVPALVVLAYALWNRKAVSGGGLAHAAGGLLLLAVVGAWLVPAARAAGSDYLYTLAFRQLVSRVVSSESHGHAFYYYLLHYPYLAFPWLLLFPVALVAAVGAWRARRESPALLAGLWFVGTFLLFSVVSGKRVGYLLPAIPACALLAGRYVGEGFRRGWPWPRVHARLVAATWALVGTASLACAAVGVLRAHMPRLIARGYEQNEASVKEMLEEALRAAPPLLAPLAIAMGLAGAAFCFWFAWRVYRERETGARPLGLLVALMLALSIVGDVTLVPLANRYCTARNFCQLAAPHLAGAEEVYMLGDTLVGPYNLYTGRVSIPRLRDADAVWHALAAPRRTAIIGADSSFAKLAPGVLDRYRIAAAHWVGRRRQVLVVNWDAGGRISARVMPTDSGPGCGTGSPR